MKMKNEKILVELDGKKKYVIQIINSKQTLNHGLVLKKVHKIIKMNQEAWLNPCIDMNTEPKKIVKSNF